MYTADDLITVVRRRLRLPDDTASGNPTLDDTELLALADEVMYGEVVPFVIRNREEHYVTKEVFELTADTQYVDIPTKAYMNIVRDVRVRPNGDTNGTEVSLPRLALEDASENPASVYGFALRDNRIYLFPENGSTSGTDLVVDYFYRPGRLFKLAEVDTLNADVSVGGTSLVQASTVVYTGFAAGDSVDIISAQSPHRLLMRGTVSAYNGSNTITLASGVGEALPAGAYVCQADQTPVPQMPSSLFPLLTCLTAMRAAEVIGAERAVGDLSNQLQRLYKLYTPMLKNRTPGEPKKMINWSSPLRYNYRRSR